MEEKAQTIWKEQFPVPRNTAASKIGNDVIFVLCLRNSNGKYPPMSSDFQFKEPPPPPALGILKSHLWYGINIFWNQGSTVCVKTCA